LRRDALPNDSPSGCRETEFSEEAPEASRTPSDAAASVAAATVWQHADNRRVPPVRPPPRQAQRLVGNYPAAAANAKGSASVSPEGPSEEPAPVKVMEIESDSSDSEEEMSMAELAEVQRSTPLHTLFGGAERDSPPLPLVGPTTEPTEENCGGAEAGEGLGS